MGTEVGNYNGEVCRFISYGVLHICRDRKNMMARRT